MILSHTNQSDLRNTRNTASRMYAISQEIERGRFTHGVIMKITEATVIAPNRWRYVIEEAGIEAGPVYEPFVRTDGLYNSGSTTYEPTGHALNVWELMNTADRIFPGIDVSNIPAGFSVGPVEGYVLCFPGWTGEADGSGGTKAVKSHWLFLAPNPIDGECVSGLLADYNFGTYEGPQNSEEFGDYDAPTGSIDFGTYNAPTN